MGMSSEERNRAIDQYSTLVNLIAEKKLDYSRNALDNDFKAFKFKSWLENNKLIFAIVVVIAAPFTIGLSFLVFALSLSMSSKAHKGYVNYLKLIREINDNNFTVEKNHQVNSDLKNHELEPPNLSELRKTTQQIEVSKFNGDKTLDNDAYKIFLSKKYNIKKNDLFNKFEVNDTKLFDTLDEALLFAFNEELNLFNAQDNEVKTSYKDELLLLNNLDLAEAHEDRQISSRDEFNKKVSDAFIETKLVIEHKDKTVGKSSYRVVIFMIILVAVIALLVYGVFYNNHQTLNQAVPTQPSAAASSNSNNNQISAQLKEEIGITMAECSGWYLSAFIILSKIPDGMDSAVRNNDLGLMTMDFAKKIIGVARADQISSSPMRQTNQAMEQGTIDQWIQTVGQKTDNCQAYLENNQPQIKLALDN